MNLEQSEARPYQSQFGGGYISANQWIAECMVNRQAFRKGVHLPPKFWDDPKWKRDFLMQIRFASQLLKIYEIAAIFRALKTYEGKRVYSLGAKHLDPLIQAEQRKLIQEKQEAGDRKPVPESTVVAPTTVRPAFVSSKKSVLGKLREIDGQ